MPVNNAVTPELRAKAKRLLDVMCQLDGINFQALCDELDWSAQDVQRCLRYLDACGYVSARPTASMQVRYGVTPLGWTTSELLAHLDDNAEPRS